MHDKTDWMRSMEKERKSGLKTLAKANEQKDGKKNAMKIEPKCESQTAKTLDIDTEYIYHYLKQY